MRRTLERLADIASFITGGALFALLLVSAQSLTVPLTQPTAVVLEGLVVTPQRVYTQSQWAQSRLEPTHLAESEPQQTSTREC